MVKHSIEHAKLCSKGQYKHYGEWLGDGKPSSWQEKLKAQIDACLAEKPPDIAAFLQAMTAAGYKVKQGRGGAISFRAEGQERFTRLRSSTLGEGYAQEDIQAIIEGRAALPEGRSKPTRKVNLIIDIQSRMKARKGPIEHTLSSSTVSAIDILNAFFEDAEVRQKFISFKEQAAHQNTETL